MLDLERIATHQNVSVTPEWVKAHFQASEGAQFLIEGKQVGIPSIVPAQREDGSCVFLSEAGQCTVHRVAPFNCAYADEHMNDEEYKARRNDAIKVQMQSWMTGDTYTKWWNILAEAGCLAKPTAERRAAYELAADKLKAGDQRGDKEENDQT